MSRAPNNAEIATLTKFGAWTKSTFNIGLFQRHCPFDCSWSMDKWGNVLIDRGLVRLDLPGEEHENYTAFSVNEGLPVLICSDLKLESVLLDCLQFALIRHFSATY